MRLKILFVGEPELTRHAAAAAIGQARVETRDTAAAAYH